MLIRIINMNKLIFNVLIVLVFNDYSACLEGVWGPWSPPSSCSSTCGLGKNYRTRVCQKPRPTTEDVQCLGVYRELINCRVVECRIDGQWGAWATATACNSTCGRGTFLRKRNCTNPAPKFGGYYCVGPNSQTQYCVGSVCTKSANATGAVTSNATTNNTATNTTALGVWSPWSSFQACSATCGTGTQVRNRTCVPNLAATSPVVKGTNCSGNATDVQSCNLKNCSNDGVWSSWSNVSLCSSSCGPGLQTRNRTCRNQDKNCTGSGVEYINCTMPACLIATWSQWSPFSSCSQSCGIGIQVRNRSCSFNNTVPVLKNACSGPASESRNCTIIVSCPVVVNCSVNNGGCEHFCVLDQTKSRCKCEEGFQLQNDSLSCEDINECINGPHNCEGMCINMEGSYMCLCRDPNKYWNMETLVCAVIDD